MEKENISIPIKYPGAITKKHVERRVKRVKSEKRE
jgi:hypothetical protein